MWGVYGAVRRIGAARWRDRPARDFINLGCQECRSLWSGIERRRIFRGKRPSVSLMSRLCSRKSAEVVCFCPSTVSNHLFLRTGLPHSSMWCMAVFCFLFLWRWLPIGWSFCTLLYASTEIMGVHRMTETYARRAPVIWRRARLCRRGRARWRYADDGRAARRRPGRG